MIEETQTYAAGTNQFFVVPQKYRKVERKKNNMLYSLLNRILIYEFSNDRRIKAEFYRLYVSCASKI